jgi:acyl-CoA synthetase (AMP-forming)/AMP-acid ligase II
MGALASRYPSTFWQLVERRATADPDAPLLLDDRGRHLTAGAYRRAAEVAAAGLTEFGVGAGTVVSWQLPTTIEGFVLLAALSRAGATQNPLVPILRHREVGFITAQVGAELLVVPRRWRDFDFAAMAREIAASRTPACGVLELELTSAGGLDLPAGDPTTLPPPPAPAAPESQPVRWLYYSSGTTAEPKGARHTDWSVMHSATALIEGLGVGPDDLYPIAFPLTHIGGMSVLTLALVTGCRLACIESFDPVRSPELMAEMGATVLGSALPFLNAYVAAQQRHGAAPLFPKLRTCVSGGAPKPPSLHREIKETLGGFGVMSSWGLTEFPIATHARADDDDETLATTEGHPVIGVQVRVADSDGNDVPPGHEGELRLKGPQAFRGYVDAALDTDAFDSHGWFRTGDLGVLEPSGAVRITGRLKDVIIRNAENISAKEVEDVVGLHPSIVDVAVVGLPDPRTGERCCAVVVAAPGQDAPTLEELAAHCRAQGLPRQKLPDRLEVVDALPRNPMGKVRKNDLRARFAPS